MSKKRIALIFSLLGWVLNPALLVGSAVHAGKLSSGISGLHQEVWNSELGLPQNTVPTMVVAKDGFLWLGTELGLVRFDGLHFTTFDKSTTPELKSNKILALLEDHEGTLWIGTTGGGLTTLRNGHFHTYTAKDGLSNNAIRCLLEDQAGAIWIGTNGGGLDRFYHGSFSTFKTDQGLADNQVFALASTPDGGLWVGTHEGLSRMQGGSFRTYRTQDGLPSSYVRALRTAGNVLWIGTEGGLGRMEQGRIRSLTTRDGLSSNSILSLLDDDEGNLWIGTAGGGINRLTPAGQFASYTAENGLPKNDVWCLVKDGDGEMWAGTGGGGLVRLYSRTLFKSYDSSRGLSSNVVLGVFEDHEGTVWVGTNGGGLNRLRNGEFQAITTKEGLANDVVFSICEGSDGALWIGTRKGLNRLKDGKFTRFTTKDGLPGDAVIALLSDSHGTMWVGTRAGLSMWKNNQFTTFTTKDGLSNNVVQALYEDRHHHLWIGTGGGGLDRLENGHFEVFNSHNGLSSDVVFAIEESRDGSLWIGTDGGGLDVLRGGRFSAFTIRDGLLDDAIFRILEDSSGALWMSSNRGVFRAPLRSIYDFADKKIGRIPVLSYGTSDGMNTRECNGGYQPAGWQGKDGRLWFPTMDGVVSVDPQKLSHSRAQQRAIIEQVVANDQVVPLENGVQAPIGDGNLEVHYTAPNFRAARRIHFQYRLEGFDKDWVHAGDRRTAFYTNVPPGTYRFRVMASNEDGSWSDASAELQVKLEPHFYQTFLFYALCAVGLVGVAGAAHLGRVRQLRERERELEDHVHQRTSELRREIAERERAELESFRARDAAERANRVKSEFLANMSHEIRTPMNAILGMTRLALATDLSPQQKQFLEISRDSADSLLTVIDDILDFSKVEAGKLDLSPIDFDLRASLEAAVKSLAFRADQKDLHLSMEVAADVPAVVHADPVRLRQVVLNLVGNAIKFTDQGEVVLTVARESGDPEGSVLALVVRDTGIGIAEEKLASIFDAFSQADSSTTRKFGGTGLGLTICHRLVNLMGGRIWATSEEGAGSQFHFTIRVGVATTAGAGTGFDADTSEAPESSLAALAGVCSRTVNVLLAEDNPANRLVARLTLQTAGFRVHDVENGWEALEAVKRRPFDLVLMDCRMPVMDGYVATEQIRRLPGKVARVPIIALTASAFKEDRERAKQAGMNDFVAKPFEDGQLIEKCLTWTRTDAERSAAGESGYRDNHDHLNKYSREFLQSMMTLFLETAPPVFRELTTAIERGDWTQAKSSAHWLRGGASRIIGPSLQQRLERVEADCSSNSPGVSGRDAELLEHSFQDACRVAEKWLAEDREVATAGWQG